MRDQAMVAALQGGRKEAAQREGKPTLGSGNQPETNVCSSVSWWSGGR